MRLFLLSSVERFFQWAGVLSFTELIQQPHRLKSHPSKCTLFNPLIKYSHIIYKTRLHAIISKIMVWENIPLAKWYHPARLLFGAGGYSLNLGLYLRSVPMIKWSPCLFVLTQIHVNCKKPPAMDPCSLRDTLLNPARWNLCFNTAVAGIHEVTSIHLLL